MTGPDILPVADGRRAGVLAAFGPDADPFRRAPVPLRDIGEVDDRPARLPTALRHLPGVAGAGPSSLANRWGLQVPSSPSRRCTNRNARVAVVQ